MHHRWAIGPIAFAALITSIMALQAFDSTKYPDLSGQWVAVRLRVPGQAAFDPTKGWGNLQQAPLKPEYQAILDSSIADQANGGQGNWQTGDCLPPGMPTMMTLYRPMEIVVLPEVTYILIDHAFDSVRRIYTDGRDWPKQVERSFIGYSIGRWLDEDGDGKFDILEVETRHLKGPRALDPAGMPTHADNESIVKERISFSKTDPKVLQDEITLIDNAFTRPWTVLKTYRRVPDKYPEWLEDICGPGNQLIRIGKEMYYRSADGNLMPSRKDQPPPDVRYFKQTQR
jgi:hypothetical protein